MLNFNYIPYYILIQFLAHFSTNKKKWKSRETGRLDHHPPPFWTFFCLVESSLKEHKHVQTWLNHHKPDWLNHHQPDWFFPCFFPRLVLPMDSNTSSPPSFFPERLQGQPKLLRLHGQVRQRSQQWLHLRQQSWTNHLWFIWIWMVGLW